MSLRNEWELSYPAEELLSGVLRKIEYHTQRLEAWEESKLTAIAKLKEQGIEVDEGPAASLNSPGTASNNPYDRPRVIVDRTLESHVGAIVGKTTQHRRRLSQYLSWKSILETQGKASFKLHHDDWMFFFGDLASDETMVV